MKEFLALTKLVNQNLAAQEMKSIDFDDYENLNMDLYHCSEKVLLNIDDSATFIKEVFLKLLNRNIDDAHLNGLLERMNAGKLDKKRFILDVYNSQERKVKKTDVIFDAN